MQVDRAAWQGCVPFKENSIASCIVGVVFQMTTGVEVVDERAHCGLDGAKRCCNPGEISRLCRLCDANKKVGAPLRHVGPVLRNIGDVVMKARQLLHALLQQCLRAQVRIVAVCPPLTGIGPLSKKGKHARFHHQCSQPTRVDLHSGRILKQSVANSDDVGLVV